METGEGVLGASRGVGEERPRDEVIREMRAEVGIEIFEGDSDTGENKPGMEW